MNFGYVLSRAWQIIWMHKVLWIFGILAGCGNAGSFSGNFRYSYRGEVSPELQGFFDQVSILPDWLIVTIIIVAVLVFLLLIILGIFLSTMGRIGLIRGTQQAEAGDTGLSFGDLFRGGLPYFWRVFGLSLLVGLAVGLAAALIAALGIAGSLLTMGVGFICFIPLVCLLVPLAWLAGIVIEQSIVALVTEDLSIGAGLQRGWEIIRSNLGQYIVMGLILILGVSALGGILIGLPIVAIIGPAVMGVLVGTRAATGAGILVSVLCLVGYIPIAILLNGILVGYTEAAWTLTYLQLAGRSAAPEPELLPAE